MSAKSKHGKSDAPAPAASPSTKSSRASAGAVDRVAATSMFSTAPESSSRELAAGKTPREKAYYIVLAVLGVAALGLAAWYFELFGRAETPKHARPAGERPEQGLLYPREAKLEALQLVLMTDEDRELIERDLKGKVVLLNLWGPWCGPCIQEFPAIAALEEKYRDHDRVLILPVAIGVPEQPEDLKLLKSDVKSFIEDFSPDRPDVRIYLDPEKLTRGAVETVNRLKSLPATLLLDGDQYIRQSWNGPHTQLEFESAIEAALKE